MQQQFEELQSIWQAYCSTIHQKQAPEAKMGNRFPHKSIWHSLIIIFSSLKMPRWFSGTLREQITHGSSFHADKEEQN